MLLSSVRLYKSTKMDEDSDSFHSLVLIGMPRAIKCAPVQERGVKGGYTNG